MTYKQVIGYYTTIESSPAWRAFFVKNNIRPYLK